MTHGVTEGQAGGRMARILGLATGFGALHAVHTAINLLFTMAQLVVLARGLDQPRYAEIVFLTAVGFYVQPVDQAIGRANYMALRPLSLGMAGGARGEVLRFLVGQGVLLVLLSFVGAAVVRRSTIRSAISATRCSCSAACSPITGRSTCSRRHGRPISAAPSPSSPSSGASPSWQRSACSG